MAQFEHLLVYGYSDYVVPTSVVVTYPTTGLGRLAAGDLSLIIVGARSEAGQGGLASAPGYELISSRGSTTTLQTMVLRRVADGTEPGTNVTVTVPGANVAAVHLLRFTKESDTDVWDLTETNKTQPGASGDLSITDTGIEVSPTGIILAWKFFFPGSNQFWLEQTEKDSELIGIPRLITEGSGSVGFGYARRIAISNVDGAPGVGPGVDGIPFVPDDANPPTAPGNLRLVSRAEQAVTIRWDPAVDDVYVSGYETHQGATHIATDGSGVLTRIVSGLSPGSTYTFKVRAVDVAGNVGPFSNLLTVTTKSAPAPEPEEEEEDPAPSLTRPEAPNSIWRSHVTTHSMTINWSGPPSGPAPSSYKFYVNDKLFRHVPADERAVHMPGLADGRKYHVRVRSFIGDLSGGSIANYYTTHSKQSSSPPPPPKRYERTWSATWSDAYRSSGSPSSTGDSYLYHGYADGFNGNQRSLIGFNDGDMRSKLKGARIISVKLRIYVIRTYWNAGGKFRYGWHKYGNRPSSWSGSNVDIVGTSGTVTSGGYRTITLPDYVGSRLRDGSAKGIAIGPAPSNSSGYYMYFAHASSSNPPKLIIEYEK